MKILLTIEEYRERIIQLVTEVVNKTVIPIAPDYFKWEFIYMLVEKAVTDDIMALDEVNQLFIKAFEYDRNGCRLSVETLKQIDQDEVDEFEGQEWYVEYYRKCKKDYCPADRITPYERINFGHLEYRLFDLIRAVQRPFIEDTNAKYHLAKEIFKTLYGHEFEYNRNFKCV
jgi:hypothetical protein